MNLGNIPVKMPSLWASSAPPQDINTIPLTSQIGINAGYASLPDGFVPLNFTPVSAGGVPVRGQDFNGVFNWISGWLQWQQAGGPVVYDGAFQAGVGGYPKGAIVQSAVTLGTFWLSTVDANLTNPDTGGAGWFGFSVGLPPNNYWPDTGAANALVVTPTIALAAYSNGLTLQVNPANANTTAATLNVSGLGATAIVNPDGTALVGTEIVAGAIMELVYQAGAFQWINAPGFVAAQIAAANRVWAASGTANALVISPTPLLSIRGGLSYFVKPAATNTSAATLNATGAAVSLVRSDGAALQAGDLPINRVTRVVYDAGISAWRVSGEVPSQLTGSGVKINAAGGLALSIEGLPAKASPIAADLLGIYDSVGLADSSTTVAALATYIGSIVLPAFADSNAFFYGLFT